MALIFPKSTDKYVKIGGGLVAVMLLGGIGAYAYFTQPTVMDTGYSPQTACPLQSQIACRRPRNGLPLLP